MVIAMENVLNIIINNLNLVDVIFVCHYMMEAYFMIQIKNGIIVVLILVHYSMNLKKMAWDQPVWMFMMSAPSLSDQNAQLAAIMNSTVLKILLLKLMAN